MTLNLTALGDGFITQVSDRRLTIVTSSGSTCVDDDDANKAVVLSCSDSLLAVTFTGLGRVRRTRVDEWLLNVLQEEGLCELEADTAIEKFSELATNWFRSIRTSWSGLHTFIFSGWQRKPNSSQLRPRLWFVTNSESVNYSTFAVIAHDKKGMYGTGFVPAFTRAERRRVQAAMRKAKNSDQIEAAMVDGIRNAASRPDGSPIGKSCMSVTLGPTRTAASRFHPFGGHPHNFAPHVVWYEGGKNIAVQGIDYLASGPYNLALGGGACTVLIRPGFSARDPPSNEILTRFRFRFTKAKYHSEPDTELDLIRIVNA